MKWKIFAAATFFIVVSAIPVASQTLTVSVTGSGRVTGTGINCGSDCSETVSMTVSTRGARPGKVTLTASGLMPATGPNWGGACEGRTGPTCTVTVPPGGATVSAGFGSLPDVGGAISNAQDAMAGSSTGTAPAGEPSSSGSSTVGPGTIISSNSATGVGTFRAEASAGAAFVRWSGVCTGSDPVCSRTFSQLSPSYTLVAAFGWPVTVTLEGPQGGRVTGEGINCPTVCAVVAVPPSLILDATNTTSVPHKEWGGDCKTAGSTTSGARCSLSITGPKSVIARFEVSLIAAPPPP